MRTLKALILALMVLALASCYPPTSAPSGRGPADTPSATMPGQPTRLAPASPVAPPTSATLAPTAQPAESPAHVAARAALAAQAGVTPQSLVLVSSTAVDWPDACLGVSQPGQMCAQVITPGYRMVFSTPAGQVEVHTDRQGRAVRMVQPGNRPTPDAALLLWERTGGLAGVCQRLTVDRANTYVLEDCRTQRIVAEGLLPPDAAAQLGTWLRRYAPFEWRTTPRAGSADMFEDLIRMQGTGTETPSVADQAAINEYLMQLAGRLMTPGTPRPTTAAGIEGQVTLGPSCPVQRDATECADRPYQANLTVIGPTGQVVTSFATDVQGRFRVALAPGTYVVRPESPGRYPRAGEITVTVSSGEFKQVPIRYDTGIR